MMGWLGRIQRMGKENADHACRMFRELARRRLVVWTCTVGLLALLLMLSALAALPTAPAPQDWTRFGYTASGTRDNAAERRLTTTTVAGLHLVWRTRLPDIADSTPVFLSGLRFPDGRTRNVLYLTTKSGSLVAIDADSGTPLWTRTTRTTPTFDPNKPTTSSPVVDPTHHAVYSYGLDGRVHQYDAITGQELHAGGWPVLVTTMRTSEKGSSALNLADGFLYVTTSSWGADAPPYQGHVVIMDLRRGTTHVFNALCSDRTHLLAPGECRDNGAGMWARPGVVVDPVTGDIFLATANGPYTADEGGHDWGDSVLRLTPDGSHLLDAYTPQQPDALYTQDQDLGSTAPALLPTIPGSSIPYLAVQAGKDSLVRLLNRQNLSGQGGPGHTGGELQTVEAPGHCPVLAQPAVWTDPARGDVWLLVASGCAIGGYKVVVSAGGQALLRLEWTVPVGATSPAVAGGVLFAATTGNKELLAVDPRTGQFLWTSLAPDAGGSIGYTHWESPIVINGHLYCTDEDGDLVAYGL